MATPIDEANSRCASRVEFSATTAKTTSPGLRYFTPSLRASSLQFGGKMEETRTRFWAAIPASRSANSKEVSRSRCFPTPLVKKIRLGTMSLPNSLALQQAKIDSENAQSNTMVCKGNVNLWPEGNFFGGSDPAVRLAYRSRSPRAGFADSSYQNLTLWPAHANVALPANG